MKTLLLCETMKELETLVNKCKIKAQIDYIILTTNPEVYASKEIEKRRYIVKLIDAGKSVITMRDSVYEIINKLNCMLCDTSIQNGKSSEYLYKIMYHIEGGIQSKIMEILCWIDFFSDIVNEYEIDKIMYFENGNYIFEKKILQLIARQKNISIHTYHKAISKVNNIIRMQKEGINYHVYCFLKRGYLILKYLKYAVTNKHNTSNNDYMFGVLMCSSAIKHINWSIPILNVIKNTGSYKVFCMNGNKAVKTYRDMGFEAECMEGLLTAADFVHLFRSYGRVYKRLKSTVHDSGDFVRNGYNFYPILFPELMKYLETAVLLNFINDATIKKYFKYNNFRIIRGWGSSNFVQTQISYHNTIHKKLQPIYFTEDAPYSFNVYFDEPDTKIYDLLFVGNRTDYEWYLEHGRETNDCHLVNNLGLTQKFNDTISRENIQKVRNEFVLLYAPSYVTFGCHSLSTYLTVSSRLIDFFATARNSTLYIKHHPNEKKQYTKVLSDKIGDVNNILIKDQNSAIELLLREADIAITDNSTVILDAIVEGKPVICIVDDCGYKMVQDMKGVLIYKDLEEALPLLEQLVNNEQFRSVWMRERVQAQNEYFKHVFINTNSSLKPEKEIVSILMERLEESTKL